MYLFGDPPGRGTQSRVRPLSNDLESMWGEYRRGQGEETVVESICGGLAGIPIGVPIHHDRVGHHVRILRPRALASIFTRNRHASNSHMDFLGGVVAFRAGNPILASLVAGPLADLDRNWAERQSFRAQTARAGAFQNASAGR